MTTNLENITTIKSNTVSLLASISSATNSQLTYSVEGRSFSWTEYQEHLMRRIDWCNAQLASEDPFEITTQAFTD